MITAKEEWCEFCNSNHPQYIEGCPEKRKFMNDNVLYPQEHSWVEANRCSICNKEHSKFHNCTLNEERKQELNNLYKESEEDLFKE